MTDEELIEGFGVLPEWKRNKLRFILKQARADQTERCAKECELLGSKNHVNAQWAYKECAEAIRALSSIA